MRCRPQARSSQPGESCTQLFLKVNHFQVVSWPLAMPCNFLIQAFGRTKRNRNGPRGGLRASPSASRAESGGLVCSVPARGAAERVACCHAGHANSRRPSRLLQAQCLGHTWCGRPIPGDRCSQGGVQFPTGGKGQTSPSPRAPWLEFEAPGLEAPSKGQQIRCDSEADGYSPDERERSRQPRLCRGALFRVP